MMVLNKGSFAIPDVIYLSSECGSPMGVISLEYPDCGGGVKYHRETPLTAAAPALLEAAKAAAARICADHQTGAELDALGRSWGVGQWELCMPREWKLLQAAIAAAEGEVEGDD